jgi:CBS domain-containing protein
LLRLALIAVVDGGRVLGVLSASDLHLNSSVAVEGLAFSWLNLSLLHLPLAQFLQLHKEKSRPLQTVPGSESVATAAEKLLVEGVHRLYVLGPDDSPATVLTARDAIRGLLDSP